jgi:ElaB/YqjD/DUF883 family membrane-anchored ribosome-binding protein
MNEPIPELIDEVKMRFDDAAAKAKLSGFTTMVKSKSFIERNPFQSVAIAVGIGYALKLLRPGPVFTAGVAGGLLYLATRFEMH